MKLVYQSLSWKNNFLIQPHFKNKKTDTGRTITFNNCFMKKVFLIFKISFKFLYTKNYRTGYVGNYRSAGLHSNLEISSRSWDLCGIPTPCHSRLWQDYRQIDWTIRKLLWPTGQDNHVRKTAHKAHKTWVKLVKLVWNS